MSARRLAASTSNGGQSKSRTATIHGDEDQQPNVPVVIGRSDSGDQFSLLNDVLDRAGFWSHVEAARHRLGVDAESFRIVVKPDTTLFDAGAPTGTDPRLVEHLIAGLFNRGFKDVSVVGTADSFGLWLENRDLVTLADLVGYRFQTADGREYDIRDLGEDVADFPFPEGSALYGTGLSRVWTDAHYRVCFAKNRTDEEHGYALCLENLLGVLPLRDKQYHYRHRLKPWDVASELLRATPCDFNLIDAFVSNHGEAGRRVIRPLATRTFVASENTLLADWAAALKMGLDPFVSPVNAYALREHGLPDPHSIEGDLEPYCNWVNVHPLLLDSTKQRNQWFEASRLASPVFQPVNRELFPFKDIVVDRINSFVTRFLSEFDGTPLAFWPIVGLNYFLAALHRSIYAWKVMGGKDYLQRRDDPVNVAVEQFTPADYEEVEEYLTPLADLIHRTPPDNNGLRWRYLDNSVLFEFSREIPVPFEEFVDRVDISRAIRFMNDYIGGRSVEFVHDGDGRPTHQLERNIYLPQPNYLVAYQGDVIDVTKLDYIRYGKGCHQIFWKTVKSENESAKHDDGIITFRRSKAGHVDVSMMGRQEFVLPPFWQAVNLDLNPSVKEFLVRHAYTAFFTRTMANFEAVHEGREIRIGQAWNPQQGEDGEEPWETRLSEILLEFSAVAAKHLRPIWQLLVAQGKTQTTARGRMDEDGFTHFPSAQPQPTVSNEEIGHTLRGLPRAGLALVEFWNDIADAVGKDFVASAKKGLQDWE